VRPTCLALVIAWTAACLAGCQQPVAPSGVPSSFMGSGPLNAAASVLHVESKLPLPSFAAFIPCVPEIAIVTDAELHFVYQQTVTEPGRVRLSEHYQPIRNWDGIGTATGTVYQTVGVTRQGTTVDVIDGFPFEQTLVNNFRWIGAGPGNNLQLQTTTHVTIDANGRVTATRVDATATCN
jgi:hypothetical protein